MKITKDNATLLVIDFQEKLVPAMSEPEKCVDNKAKLIEGARILGLPIVVSEQYPQGLGSTVPAIREVLDKEIDGTIIPANIIAKRAFSCLDEEKILNELEKVDRDYVLVCGIESHICVLQTIMDLSEKGFIPVLVEDCVFSRKENDKTQAVKRAAMEGAIVTTYESILFELLGSSTAPEFKAISKLIK